MTRTPPLSLSLLLAWTLTTGAAGHSPEASAGAEVPTAQSQPEETAQRLAGADAAFAAGHLIYPARGSAMALYQEVLLTDPGNAAAQRGLERLVEHFLEEASRAIEREQYIKADSMLSKARMIDRDNPNIEPLAKQLRLLEEAERHRVTLDWRLVSARSSELAATLERLGGLARGEGCRAMISVSSDAEGRWVYQQMSRAPGERRIKAQMRIASPAAVEVLCFDAATVVKPAHG